MHDDNLWQLFANNGTPITGKGATPETFDADESLTMGNAHVWFWKKNKDGVVEIILQKRGPIKRRPGWLHISAAGHIDIDETPLQAAVRESKEEMGIIIDPTKLYFVQTTRHFPRAPHDIVNVYLYQLTGDETFTHQDGEVAGIEWHTLDDFKQMIKNPESHKLVPMGDLYFGMLVAALEYSYRTKT
jgi:8-oxo-dGTP pyrophosphatase MutT (NUDIX family)